MPTLGAILLNPPTSSGLPTIRHLQVAAELLGCDSVVIGNLFATATDDVTVVNIVGAHAAGWTAARPHLLAALDSDVLIAGWGVSGLHGAARGHREDQVRWVLESAVARRHPGIWTINGDPRHPSRWHQYVSERHGRASGLNVAERLHSVLLFRPLPWLSGMRAESQRRAESHA
jgi:hypothetical protein